MAMERSYKRIAIAVCISILTFCLSGVPAAAVDPASPTTFSIIDAAAYHNLYELGDSLYIFHYNIYYASDQPTTPADKLFLYRLMDTDGTTQLGSTVPYPYNNSGYDEGIGGFYFAADVAPTWETAVIIRMEGNPQYWSAPPVATYTYVLSDYCQFDTQTENQTQLGNWVLNEFVDLEVNWGIKLTTEGNAGTVLNTTGETYIKGTIAGFKEMCPQIFGTTITSNTVTDAPYTARSAVYEWEHQWDGTWVEDALTGFGGLFGIGWKMVTAIITLILTIVVAGISQMKWGTTDPGFLVGMIIFSFASIGGMIDWQMIGAGALLCVLYFVYVVLWRQG